MVAAGEASELSEALTATVLATAPDAIISFGLDRKITSWNPAAAALFRYAAEDAIGRSVETLIPPALVDETRTRMERVISMGAAEVWETELLRADQVQIPARLILSALKAGSGVLIGVAAIIRDVSEERRYARAQRISSTLQRSLVRPWLPDVPGVTVATRYLPGTTGLEIGGDWYDVIPLSPLRIGVAIGDVMGTGLGAATAMGQLRSALRIYAVEGLSSGPLMERLNQLVDRMGDTELSTLFYLRLTPSTGMMTYANAGHCPPLVVDRDGNVDFLRRALSIPLGTLPDEPYDEAAMMLPVGATLLLYTDGLIESRHRDLGDGLAQLAKAAAMAPQPLEDFVDFILSEVADAQHDDDLAMLALRRERPDAE